MALQGTLETFSVPEVLRLLSGTRKTGLLALDGDRGTGKVWLVEGTIAGARSDHEAEGRVEAVLFDLLRFRDGAFVFETDAPFDAEPAELDVEEALTEAERLLADWREIESVVPSLDVWVSMVAELSGASVTVTAEQWSSLAIIGRGTSGNRLGDDLGLGELDTSRRIRDLVEAGLVAIDDAPAPADLGVELAGFVATGSAAEVDEVDEDHDVYEDHEVDAVEAEPAFVEPTFAESDLVDDGTDGPEAAAEPDLVDDGTDEAEEPAAETGSDEQPDIDGQVDGEVDGEVADSEEFLAQLANLSPKAAAAIEATASEQETAGRPRLPNGEGDEEINRNLLLKFLSSAKN